MKKDYILYQGGGSRDATRVNEYNSSAIPFLVNFNDHNVFEACNMFFSKKKKNVM